MESPIEVRGSRDYPLDVGWLPEAVTVPGAIGLTFAPGKKGMSRFGFRWERDLGLDLDALRAMGASVLVTLMQDRELLRWGIEDLPERGRAKGLEVLRLAIPDLDVPASFAELEGLLAAIDARLAEGRKVVIHCLGGLGRTGTVAGCCLVRHGVGCDEAFAMLRAARGEECPQTEPQRDFIRRFARQRESGRGTGAVVSRDELAKALPVLALEGPSASKALAGGARRADVGALLGRIEDEVGAAPERCFRFDGRGHATLAAQGRTWAAGHFTVPTLGELRAQLEERRPRGAGRLRLSILHGRHPLTDIGTLQATAAPGTLFQVASQFNCLEAMEAYVAPVREYVRDPTQGPRASVSAFPGTFLRRYRAPGKDGARFVQRDGRCLNLLEDAFGPEVAEVRDGYLETARILDPSRLAAALEERFEHVRVGLHDDVEVAFGYDWGGPVPGPAPRVAQVFTSTLALGAYGRDDGSTELARARRQLLRAAYLGTLLGALALEKRTVVLTLIGGGVFGNPPREIWDAIGWALAEAEPLAQGTVEVVVNARESVEAQDRAAARARGGTVVEVSAEGIVAG